MRDRRDKFKINRDTSLSALSRLLICWDTKRRTSRTAAASYHPYYSSDMTIVFLLLLGAYNNAGVQTQDCIVVDSYHTLYCVYTKSIPLYTCYLCILIWRELVVGIRRHTEHHQKEEHQFF